MSSSNNYQDTSSYDNNGSSSTTITTETSDSGKNQATWRWDCCSCARGTGMNNSYLYSSDCTDCGHSRCDSCDVWRTGH
ncbi:hypothetical protein F4821DRAFT_62129 [Hypoxylon rubiginosum]|uniref:Uncharacterized protein n=1 Tax=Hypoxylon rubiginosum TaxID=110542 RepID=A0ACC0D9D3_9PEZI|nr:hypothetical protein F4821DRAFT_62129 [Hypoxylon rubiginosum]